MVADFPSETDLAHMLLMLVHLAGGPVRTADTYEPLAHVFKVSDKALSLKTATGVNTWHTKVRSAREWLAKRDLVPRPQKKDPTSSQKNNTGYQGWWQLTSDGEREAIRQLSHWGTSARLQLNELAEPIEKLRSLHNL